MNDQIDQDPAMTDEVQVFVPPLLHSLRSVVYAVITPGGRLVAANNGFCHLIWRVDSGVDGAKEGRDISAHFVNPTFAELMSRQGGSGEILYEGLLNFSDFEGRVGSLLGAVYRRDGNIEVVGEHDIREYEHLFATVLSLNDELAGKQRELVRANRAQAALLEKLALAQNQLMQREMMASIGQLAAGVAHEINNPIGFVSSNLGTLGEYLSDLLAMLDAYVAAEQAIAGDVSVLAAIREQYKKLDIDFIRDDAPVLLSESREGLKRVKQIVLDLKDFSNIDQAEWQMADLHKGLESAVNVVASELRNNHVEIHRQYGVLPPIYCSPGEINRVVMSLLVNSAQAIESQGVITLRTGCDEGWAWIDVEDSGRGILAKHLSRIFEPFFTTKPVGQGVGLGLTVSYGIVQKHGGRIEVNSEEGKGTRVRVFLPVRTSAEAHPGN